MKKNIIYTIRLPVRTIVATLLLLAGGGSGIYRHVWMMVTDAVQIADWDVTITTPDVFSKKATVQIKTLIKNETWLANAM